MTIHDRILEAARRLQQSISLVVLTGAGVSKESGIPTFRDALDGLWARYDPQQLATPEAFRANPRLVWDWYEHRRQMMYGIQPNPGHYALAALEDLLPQVVIVTQNIDGLHKMAGSTDIIPLHGNIHQHKCFANCQGDPTLIDISTLDWDGAAGPPECPYCGSWVRPDVVWFNENLPRAELDRAITLSKNADVMLVVGTSGVVQPAASLPYYARRYNDAFIIDVNPIPSEITPIAQVFLEGPSGEILPHVVRAMRESP
ncbi:MAG: NAD-dependent deacylase [Anaerolineae bacterium]|nr:NAD-dependent deacylase [Anaerolineae bacterium]